MTPESEGDTALAEKVSAALGRQPGAWAAAEVSADGVRLCSEGADLDADFEIGSVSKGLTGLLYVDALGRGELDPQTTLADCLELGGSPIGAIPLAYLATHTAGLPRLGPGSQAVRRTWELWRHGTNPYRETLPEFLDLARQAKVATASNQARPAYTNFGFQLLGHAVAAAAGLTYAELLHARLVQPLGLTSTYVPTSTAGLRPTAVAGTSRRGRVVEPWANLAIAPAGGVRASAHDLGLLLAALVDGSAPGIAALEPVRNFSGKAARIGAGWHILETPTGLITWHNGGTGGFRSWLGLDRARGLGFAVVSANTRSVDRCGFDHLTPT